VFLRGNEVVVKDLDSTNGTFINGEKTTEAVLKPGQTLRLGQIELKLEAEGAPSPAPAPAAPSSGPQKKPLEQTVVMRGVSLNELEQGPRTTGFDTASRAFSKKSNKTNQWFLIGGIIAIVVIVLVLVIALAMVKK
jgi:pSer/pThr/pTyr-binding forkhead associated (FHA) protein